MSSRKSLSVVMIAKNEAGLLPDCLRSVEWADEIIVLEAGEIVERGGHEALLAANGRYAAMWQTQYSEEQEPH